MKLFLIITAAAVLHLALGASISDVTCPDSCTCKIKEGHCETSCLSYEFIKKLLPKQESTIVRLNINNASLINIDLKLKYLKNLHTLDLSRNNIAALPSQFPYLPKLKNLDLSHNRLSNAAFAHLPKNLENIDLSHNTLADFPKDLSTLKQLKTLRFHDNPIDCDNCDNLAIYEQLLNGNIIESENLTCSSPREFYGRHLNTVNCSLIKENLLNSMLGDEAGSGLEDGESVDDSNSSLSEDELIEAEHTTDESENELIQEEVEGSGDEGSGEMPIIVACVLNCSTPRSIGLEDEHNALTLRDPIEQGKMIIEDILYPITGQLTTIRTDLEEDTENSSIKEIPEIDEDQVEKKKATELEGKREKEEPADDNESDKNDVETVPTNDTVIGEMERASFENSNNQSVYIIVGLLIAFVAFLLIYFINKKKNERKRNQRKRNKSNENGFGEEMKPLGKSAESAKPVEQINSKVPNSEASPLLNGNGKIAEENNVKSPPVVDEEELEDVELRKPDGNDTLTPQPERVTIKAGELPDSIPKTPLLVHRQLNSDGEIVTTAINSN